MSEAVQDAEMVVEEAHGNEMGELVVAALAGAMAGAMAGLMLAPDRGVETRRRICEGMRSCCSTCRERLQPLLQRAARRGWAAESAEED
jgi:gas vesicle protein